MQRDAGQTMKHTAAPAARRWIMAGFCAAFAVYSVNVYTVGTEMPGGPALTPAVQHGLALFQQSNCIACHQFYGLGGYMGPDLTNVVSAPDKGPDYARAFIENGTARMPNFGFGEAQVNDLVRFLEFVDASGAYPPKSPEINWNGTVAYDAARHNDR
jgi:nitric oxide reductase subunit C